MVSPFAATIFACLIVCIVGSDSFTCPFSNQCNCTLDVSFLVGQCDDVAKIEDFSNSRLPISSLTISGNFTSIPSKVFNGIAHPVSNLVLKRTENAPLKVSLTFNNMSFYTESNAIISSVKFIGYKTDLFAPTNGLTFALANAADITELIFDNCRLDTLKANSFKGIKALTKVDINNANLVDVEENAFNGAETTLNQLSLAHNDLVEMPKGLERLKALVWLDLSDNHIEEIGAERVFQSSLRAVDISDNPLRHINDTAFSKVEDLKQLILNRCNFTEIPSVLKLENVYPFLQDVQLNGNKIHRIDDTFTNSFTNLTKMPGLNDNPVAFIDDGAFSGLVKVERVYVTNYFDLNMIDISDFSSEKTPDMKSIRIENFRLLEFVNVTENAGDGLKLISITYCDRLSRLGHSFADWLESPDNILDISNNKNFKCDDLIKWVAKYAFCSFHPQVIVENSFCADTRVPLEDYLRSFDNICDA